MKPLLKSFKLKIFAFLKIILLLKTMELSKKIELLNILVSSQKQSWNLSHKHLSWNGQHLISFQTIHTFMNLNSLTQKQRMETKINFIAKSNFVPYYFHVISSSLLCISSCVWPKLSVSNHNVNILWIFWLAFFKC